MKTINKLFLGLGFFLFTTGITYAQPANDQCSGAQTVTPNGSCVAGTTVAATDNWSGAVGCQSGGNANSHNDVWYTFVSTGSIYTGTVTASAPFAGDVEFILVSSATGCTGPFTIVGSACGPSPLNISIPGLTNGTTYYFTISNQGNGTPGPFTVCSTTAAAPCSNTTCSSPVSISYTTGVQTCITDCNTGAAAGPDFTGTNCYDYPSETVWYTLTTGASTASIDIALTSAALTNPYFTVFTTSDCISYTIIDCIQGSSGSASGNVLVSANTTYLIAVSDAGGLDGNFNLCVTVNNDNSACNTNNSLVVTATSMGSPLTGPYQPSEIVTFRYTITNWQQINCNYLQGIVPEFGDCWDPTSFNANGQPVNIPVPLVTAGVIQPCAPGPPCAWNACVGTPNGTWSWFAAGQVTYNNIAGSLPPNSPMPGGWYFLSSYNPATGACNGDPTDPDNSFGDGNFPACGTNTLDWTITFQLQARSAISGCGGSLTDCHVTIRTYADGEIGVWNNIGCTADATGAGSMASNLCCTAAPTVTTPVTYCQNAVASPLTATGTSLLWYTTATGGVGSATAPTPSTATVGTTNYYVSQTTGGCESPRSLIAVTIYNPATVAANADQIICAGSAVTLAGSIGGGATSATWSGGTGTFAPNATTLNATYTPSAAEVTAGTVTLTLTTNDPAGPCGAVNDVMVITINPAATVNANVDQTICSGSTVTLAGSIGGGATSATWSGGGGTFTPNATTLNAVYTPTAANIAAGTVTLTLTTNDPAGPCPAVSDAMVITINSAATVNANVDQTICSGSSLTLAGSIGGGATSATWTGGSGTFAPNASTLGATYTPSAADIAAGTVTMTLTTNDPAGPCPSVSDAMVLTINPAATVNANVDQTICSGSTVTLAGSIGGGATTATWTGGTGTYTPNATTLGATYTPSAADISAGTVTLTLTTNDPAGPCLAVSDQMIITINPIATVNANVDQTICSGSTVTLAGSIGGGATSATWSGGGGTFTPNATTLNAVYTPTAANIAAGTVTLTLTTNDPAGPCLAVSDQMIITINPAATVNANVDQTICSGSAVTLAGSIGGGATSATWSGGSGTFTPNATTLNATYTPSAADISTGTVTLTLATNDPAGPCPAVTDQMVITINTPATANANADQTICAGSSVSLAGIIGGSATSATWSGGTGTFAPNATTLTATYTPSAAEVTAGTVTLALTTNDPAGPCPAATDQMVITINTPATSNANINQTICEGLTVALAGSIGGSAVSATWSGGTGTFAPNATTLNAVYTPSAADITAGTVTLTLTTNDPAGPCPAATDQMIITITPKDNATFSYASSTYCQTGTDPSATITGLGGGTFSSTAGLVFLSTATGLIDLSASTLGTYVITYTTNGPCPNTHTYNITITTAPSAVFSYATPFCQGGTNPLPSFGPGASAGVFSSTAGLNFVNTATGEINLATSTPGTYTITNSIAPAGGCAAASSTNSVTINTAPTVSANVDQVICSGSVVTLAGTIGGSAASATWTGGTGTFAPNANTLTATYTPSAADITAGTVTLTLTTDDPAGPCIAEADQMIITINTPATANAAADQIICAGSTVTLAGSIGGSAGSATWSGGTGTYAPNATTLTAVYTPSAAEITAGTVTLTLTTNDPAGPCPASTDQMLITINPPAIATAGANQTICAGSTVALAGSVSGGASSGTWSGGSGTFAPNATTLNAVYTPSAGDISAGSVTLTLSTNDPAGPCNIVTDQLIITINPPVTVNANSDQTICAGSTVTLAGTIGGSATSATWTGGTGAYTPNATTLGAVYTPSAADIAAGTVTLTLTTNDPAGPCPALTDQMIITINPAPTVGAGVNQTICAGSSVTLAGTVGGGATSGTWSGGSGTFAPNATTLNAVYTPSAAEVSTGSVTLVLTTNDPAGPCVAVTDQMTITINNPAVVNANVDQTICAGSTVPLSGTIGGSAASATWSGGTGTYAPNATTLGAVYTPSAAEVIAGTVTLTLTTDDPAGPCSSVSDQITITINTPASVNANADQTICEGSTVTLAGTLAGSAISGTWSGGTGTFSPNANTLGAVYTPSLADITIGTVTLTLTSDDPAGPCNDASDQMVITINPLPVVNANIDQTICSNSAVSLSGTIGGGATSATWTGGTGTYAPNANTLNATYTPSAAEITAGTVTLTLTTNDPAGPCVAVSDQMIITIDPIPTVSAAADQTICVGSSVTLAGAIGGGASSATWTGGSGIFSPDANTLNAVYTPSLVDQLAGTVTLTLSTDDPSGPCNTVSDQMVITIDPPATVYADVDQIICSGTDVTLSGTIGGSAASATWSGGTGTYNPDANTLNAVYTPSASEIAAGIVTLTLTSNDPAGPCNAVSDQVVITIDPAATANANTDQTICEGFSATLNGIVGGGAASGTWSGGTGTFNPDDITLNAVYTPSAAEILAGSVTLTLTTNDPIGPCDAVSDQVTITITPSDNSAFNYSSSTLCQTGSDPAAIVTGLPGGTFSSTAGVVFLNTTTGLIDLSASTLGNYVIQYITNGPCPDTSTFNVTITDAPSAAFSYNGPYCEGGINPLPVFGPGASAGVFSSTAGLNIVNPLTGEIDLATSTPGTYIVTNIIAAGGGCAADTSTNTITIDALPTANAGTDIVICANATASLSGIVGNGAVSGSWSGGAGTYTPDANTLSAVYAPSAAEISAGIATLVLTSEDPAGPCGSVTDTVLITINVMDNASFGYASFNYCQFGTNPLPSVGGLAGGTFSSTSGLVIDPGTGLVDLAASTAGTYVITYTTNGQCPNTSTFNLTVNSLPNVNAGIDTLINCTNPAITLNATSTSTVSFVWTGTSIVSGDSTATPVVDSIGTYVVTVTDLTTGCSSMDSLVVSSDFATPNVFAGNDTTILCSVASITLNGTSTTAGVSYSWTGPGVVSGGNTSTPVINLTGDYVLTVQSPVNGCSSSDTVNVVTSSNPPVADAGVDVAICEGASVNLNATGGATYVWTPAITLNNDSIANPIATPLVTTMYTVLVADTNGCVALDSVLVTVNVLPNPQITGLIVACQGQTENYAVIGLADNSYIWTITGGSPASANSASVTVLWNTIGAGSLAVIQMDTLTLCSGSDTLAVTINETPVAIASADVSICLGTSTTITAELSTGTPPLTYTWEAPLGSGINQVVTPLQNTIYTVTITNSKDCSSMDSVSVSVYPLPAFTLSAVGTSCSDYTDGSVSSTLTTTQPVVYLWSTTATTAHLNGVGVGNYSLTVVDANGCTAVDSIDVISLDLDSCLVIPSVFTPNNDGKNDKFEIKHIELFPNATVEIYNRWGDLVFKSDNYANPSEWWDGTYNGKDATLGSFVYIIKLSPEKDPINGIISIVK